jgi:PKD repeat protein
VKKIAASSIGILLLMVLGLSCTAKTYTETNTKYSSADNTQTYTTTKSAYVTTTQTSGSGVSYDGINISYGQDIYRMIVRTGNVSILVANIPDTLGKITTFAEQYNGYVVSSRTWRDDNNMHGTISIRIPSDKYDITLNEINQLADEVMSQNTTSEDVTEEYTDLNAKLTNLQAAEQQLLTIMNRAEKVEDVLAVQAQLTDVRSQIEQIKGRMQYLERTSSTSLINITLEQSQLTAKFTADKTQVDVGERIRFVAELNGGVIPYSLEWDFGDGDRNNDQTALHEYKKSGDYTITLKVIDDRGTVETEVRENYITVLPGWSAGSTAGAALNGIAVFGRVLANIFIWLGIFSPVWIIGVGIPLFFHFRRKRKLAKSNQVKG